MTDITELEKSNNLLEQYKKEVDDSAIVSKTDRKGQITYVNDKFVNISGYSREELYHKNHRMVKSEHTSKELFHDMWKTIKAKKIWYGNIENRKKDGSSYFVAATIIPIIDENEQVLEYIALRYDITEQIEAVEKAKKAENTKSLFLANMSHEIRTPLNAIIGFTKILKNSQLAKKEAGYINIIDTSAENLLGIVNDVLDFSKIENGSLVCESIEFNPFKEFNAVVDLFTIKAKEREIHLLSSIDSKILQKLIGDPLRIKQVLSNLISNAIKFSSDNSKININIKLVSKTSQTCTLGFSVEDSGIGISKEKQKTIFEDFTQADDSTSREYGGTGLGLSISSKIVEALDSKIEIHSEENIGSKFFFDIVYEIGKTNNKNLEELKKIKIGIILSKHIEEYDCDDLKIYLESIVDVTIYKNIDTIMGIEKEHIIILDESNSFDNLLEIDSLKSAKIIILSKEQKECDRLKNGVILNVPFNRSVMFDMLVGLTDSTYGVNFDTQIAYTQYNGKILVAEDHEINQQLIGMLLELRNIEHIFANNGQEAVELFKKEHFDMLLMDINMPIKNGKEATQEIREYEKKENLQSTPILALTANAIEGDKEKTMKVGFDDYLLKPLDEIKLDEVFRRYLEVEKEFNAQETILTLNSTYSIEDASKQSGLPMIVMNKIITSFIDTIDKDLEKLNLAIEKNDFNEIESFSHKIKGAALNLRMENISKVTENIESQAINKENISLESNFELLKKEIEQIKLI